MSFIFIAVTGGSIAHSLRPLPLAMRLRQMGARVVFGGQGPYLKFIAEKRFPVISFPMLDYVRVLKMMDSERFHLRGISEYQSAVSNQRSVLETIRPDVVLQDGPDPALPLASFEAGIKHVNLENATVIGLAGPQNVLSFRPWLHKRTSGSEKWSARLNLFLILQRNMRINFPTHVYIAQRGISFDQIPQSSLIPDLPELFNARTDISGKAFIGPLLHDPDTPRPEWWNKLDSARPLIYLGIGSSGGKKGMQTMIDALANTDYQVVLSTSDAFDPVQLAENFFAARMVPLTAVLQRASAMIYHGGSSTTYMGIKYAVPMVAIPAHFDQELNARAVAAKGLGISILPHELTVARLQEAVKNVTESAEISRNLKRFQYLLAIRQPAERGAELVLELARRSRSNSTYHSEFDISKMKPLEFGVGNPGAHLRLLRKLAPIKMTNRVLMIGCKDGEFARHIIERVGCELLCTENHPSLVRRARSRGLLVKTDSIKELPPEDSDFDLVILMDHRSDLLPHVRERLAAHGRVVIRSENKVSIQLREAGFTNIRETRKGKDFWSVGCIS